MLEYGTNEGTSDWSESNGTMCDGWPQELRSDSARAALKSANEKLHLLTCHKNPVIRYGYKYMAHHYVYVHGQEVESYAEASHDAKWKSAMEEEMKALAENETWDLSNRNIIGD